MPHAVIRSAVVATGDEWSEALEQGLDDGLDQAAEAVISFAKEVIDARRDPWGSAYEPLSATTLKLYATEDLRPGDALRDSLAAKRPTTRNFTISARGNPSRYAYIQQFGNPNNHLFNNEKPAPIPARAILPIRESGIVELPDELRERVLELLRLGVRAAVISTGIQESGRALRQLRRRR